MARILLTGATDGLGKATAKYLAGEGHHLILHGRNPDKGQKLIKEISAETGSKDLLYYNADFTSLAQIKKLAQDILANTSTLDILINNAGLGVEHSRRGSKDGIEMIFQVDYLSTYILSNLLAPLLSRSKDGQIINISSAGQAAIDFNDPLLEKSWSGVQAYCQAKLCQITLTFKMAGELKDQGIRVNALHPASYMPTKIVTHMFSPQNTIDDGVSALANLISSTVSPNGKYFFKQSEGRAQAQAYSVAAQQQLIALSENLTGIPYE